MSSHEVETTYAPATDSAVPDLTSLKLVSEVRGESATDMSAVYFDTADLALLRAGVSLRRRTGGNDEGWHLKLPAGVGREEIRRPLGSAAVAPPKAMRDLLAGWTRLRELEPVASVATDRSPTLLLDKQGTVLAELADDRVTGSTPDGRVVCWREWELELVEGTPDLLEDADRLFAAAGVDRAEADRKLARVLGDRIPAPPRRRPPKANQPVSRLVEARIAEQVAILARRDVEARRGTDEGIHKLRVTCRRLRALLATSRPVLDRDQTDPVREEIRWLAGVLGAARDAAVVHELLHELVEQEPRGLVHGPVRSRLRSTYGGRGKPELRDALESDRYFALRDRLDRLVAEPPWTELADAPAREVAPQLLRKELKRFRKRARAAAGAEEPTRELHEVRKAAKRVRYAAETVEPVAGKSARRLAHDARRLTSHLGELQDAAVSRVELLTLSRAAAAAGEPTFTYGRLHAREQSRADRLASTYWASDPLRTLTSSTRKAEKAVLRK
jgi:CHAD domain-containing protein